MKDERYLLDTSALLTLIEDEAGADRVEEVLRRAGVPGSSALQKRLIAVISSAVEIPR